MTTKKMTMKARAETKKISGASIPSADPEDFTLVEDANHLLFDDRVHLAIQEPLVLSIMTHGVLDAVTVVRDGTDLLVCDGRQRVKNAREANRRLKAEGALPVKVPYVCKRGTDARILGVMASSFIRSEDSPVSRAHKMQKHVDIGRSHEDIAVDFGCSAKAVRESLALLDCAPAVRKAVDAGEIAAKVAKTLAALPRAEQATALAEMRAAGETKGKRAQKKAEEATGKKPREKMLSRKEVEALFNRLAARPIDAAISSSDFSIAVLSFVLGDGEGRFAKAYPWHAGLTTDEPCEPLEPREPSTKSANGHSTHPVPAILAGGRP